jgi:hypothetical protein
MNLLFISPLFHKKTGSNLFICELLKSRYTIDYCYLDWIDDSNIHEHAEKKYDLIVCWQIMLSDRSMSCLTFDKGVFFPMFDDCKSVFKTEVWWTYRNFTIISFSSFLYSRLKIIGLDSHYIQYFPKITEHNDEGSSQSIFFWNRRAKMNINIVGKLFSNSNVSEINWHQALDPDQKLVPLKDKYLDRFKVKITKWFDSKKEMYDYRDQSAYYIAPRISEGIGHSFLEAMASGRCVIAPNKPTMNEYIKDGENGLLYNPKNIKAIGKHDLIMIKRNARLYCSEGHKQWNKNKSNIFLWIERPTHSNYFLLIFWLFIRFLSNPLKVIKSLLSK